MQFTVTILFIEFRAAPGQRHSLAHSFVIHCANQGSASLSGLTSYQAATEKAAAVDSLEEAVAIAATDVAELRMRLAAAETAAAEADAGALQRQLEEADAERARLPAAFRNWTLYIPREIGHFAFSKARNRTL